MSSIGYTFSYSGADCKTFAFFPGVEFLASKANSSYAKDVKKDIEKLKKPIFLDSLATVSISVHEAKSPVRRLGERGVAGYTRGIRTIAGTMVFVVIEDHPLRKLAINDPANVYPELIGWSRDLNTKGVGSMSKKGIKYNNKIATLISPMNIVMHYQTEVGFIKEAKDKEFRSKLLKKGTPYAGKRNDKPVKGNTEYNESLNKHNKVEGGYDGAEVYKPSGASMMLEGVEFVNEGVVTSVNDMVTEVVVQFVAQDFTEFTYEGDSLDKGLNDSLTLVNKLSKESSNKNEYRRYYQDLIDKTPVQNNTTFGTSTISIDGYNR